MKAFEKRTYVCGICKKEYDRLEHAETCCSSKEEIYNSIISSMNDIANSIPNEITNAEEYVRVIYSIGKLDKLNSQVCRIGMRFDGFYKIKAELIKKCKYFIDDVANNIFEDLNNRYSDIFNKCIIIGDTEYEIFDSFDFIENYFKLNDDDFKNGDFTCKRKVKVVK